MFTRATKQKAKLRLALAGPAGSGKTYTALALAMVIADGGRVAVIDTENGSASKYGDLFSFDAAGLNASTGFSPERYLELLRGAEADGYDVIVIDSLSHEWAGREGILEAVDQAASRVSGNKFVAWGQVTPRHDKLVRAIVESPAHVICTLRAKMEYVQEKNDRGRTEVRAVGMKPIQRDELEYEFDVYGLLDQDNRLVVRKSRCPYLNGAVIEKPGHETADVLLSWLSSGSEAAQAPVASPFVPSNGAAAGAGEDGATTPPASAAAPSTHATTDTAAGFDPETVAQRWARLVKEAERVNLPTLGAVKAIDTKTVGEPQLRKYADRLEERLGEAQPARGAA